MSDSVQYLILALVLLLLAFNLFSYRRFSQKLNALGRRLSKEVKGQGSSIKRELSHQYHQIESLEQLLPLLKLTSPLPPSRGWAASPDFLLTLANIVKREKPKLMVELGSGVSTLVAAKSGAKKIISLDHSLEFGGATRTMLKEHRVSGVEIRISELTEYPSGHQWYSPEALKGIKNIDILVIDGPPSSINKDARYPALQNFLPLLSKKAIIILDDASREDEARLAKDFADALPGHVLTVLHHEKGTAIISPR